jgi:flagellar protein FliS
LTATRTEKEDIGMYKAAQAYRQTQVTTSQGEVVVLLYDGALKFLTEAKECLAVKDMAGKGNCISKTLDVLQELEGSLNLERGGDLARNLRGLYAFCAKHLVQANLKKRPQMIDEVIKIIAGLRNAYAEIVNTPEGRAAAQEAGSRLRAASIAPAARPLPGSPDAAAPGAGTRARAMYAKAALGKG